MEYPDALFNATSLFTFAGAVAATTLVPNVLATMVELPARTLRFIAFGVAMGLALVMAITTESGDWIKWLVAFFNGLLIYLSALGANETLSRGLGKGQGEADQPVYASAVPQEAAASDKRRFFSTWF